VHAFVLLTAPTAIPKHVESRLATEPWTRHSPLGLRSLRNRVLIPFRCGVDWSAAVMVAFEEGPRMINVGGRHEQPYLHNANSREAALVFTANLAFHSLAI
jgi:hypothetical protein